MVPIFIIWLLFSPLAMQSPPVEGVNCLETNEKIKAAMRYHGILSAYEVEPGVFGFKRNGQTCMLFTENFEKSFKERRK